MAFRPVVRHAIANRRFRSTNLVRPIPTATVEVVVRLDVDPERLKHLGGREHQLNLTDLELRSVQPIRTTLFGNRDDHRSVRLIINGRKVWLLSVTETGIIVYTKKKLQVW